MDERTAREIIELDNRFYAAHAASFSATRSVPWEGWRRVTETARAHGALPAPDVAGSARVLDAACGNLRFERFLAAEFPRAALAVDAVDACPELMAVEAVPAGARPRRADLIAPFLADTDEGGSGPVPWEEGAFDLAVCFGFLHHVPDAAARARLLRGLVRCLRPGGLAAVSLWRPLDDPRLAAKAARAGAMAAVAPPWPGFDPGALEPGDAFLGWQDDPAPLRYCHHFDEGEVDRLARAAAPAGREVARFSADGAGGAANRYLILQRT